MSKTTCACTCLYLIRFVSICQDLSIIVDVYCYFVFVCQFWPMTVEQALGDLSLVDLDRRNRAMMLTSYNT